MNSVRFLLKSLGLPVPGNVKAAAFVRKFRKETSQQFAVIHPASVAPFFTM